MTLAKFAVGKHALGICDRCGQTHKLRELKGEFYKRRPTGVRVCDSCWDGDHPQNFHGEITYVDGISLRDPRPDTNVDDSRTLTGELVFPPINGVPDLGNDLVAGDGNYIVAGTDRIEA